MNRMRKNVSKKSLWLAWFLVLYGWHENLLSRWDANHTRHGRRQSRDVGRSDAASERGRQISTTNALIDISM